jgi:para-nitrobenzyl esterase
MILAVVLQVAAVAGSESVKQNASPASEVVSTDAGKVQGVTDGAIVAFKGIPYAMPPVGQLRWRPPQPAQAWSGVRSAQNYGNDCEQNRYLYDSAPSTQPMSEDCLYLNVWTPMHLGHLAPVMVWVHGGGLTIGSSAPPVTDGSAFARKGVVLAGFNYRLGRFGFFAHPALLVEHPGEPVGDYGLMDQLAALKWIKRNIAAFGGDPDNITVFGQSAGAVSILHLMTMPSARGLFVKAIVQSGTGRLPWAQLDRDVPGKLAAATAGLNFAMSVGITGADKQAAAALRALPAKQVLGDISLTKLESPTYVGPIIDGTLVSANTDVAFRSKAEFAVPLLIGTTDDELGGLPEPILVGMTSGSLAPLGHRGEELSNFYKQDKGRPEDLIDDMGFVEPARFLAGEHLATGAPVWLYRFGYVAEANRQPGKGARHASEVPFVFGTLDRTPGKISSQDQKMSESIQAAWIAFARSGNPNAPGIPNWPAYSQEGRLMMFSKDGPVVAPDPAAIRLDRVVQTYAANAP